MPIATILTLIGQYGPTIIPMVQQLVAWAEGGKTAVTSADLDVLNKLCTKSAADYLASAGGPPVAPKA